jgi:glycosyltransferase involved in cell wall biosynthesis
LYYNKEFKQLSFAKKRNLKLETSVFKNADCVLTVSNSLKKDFVKKANRVEVITNGFDDEVITKNIVRLDNKFSISYIGLLPKQSNPKLLFKVLQTLCLENTDFKKDLKLNFIGDISEDVKQEIEVNNLLENTSFTGYVSHREAIKHQKKAQVLLLLIPDVKKSKGILTGKLFEYLTAKRPILAIGPETGDLSEILKNTNAGVVVGFDNEAKLTSEIKKLYQQYISGTLQVNSKNIEQYHRKELTKNLSEIIKNL